MMQIAKRRRGRPETAYADYGPRQRLENGTAVLAYRADPDRPQAPDMRAARAFVAYEALDLTHAQLSAARRIHDAAEAVTGARSDNGCGLGGRAFWQVGGPAPAALAAAADLRDLRAVAGRDREVAVLVLVADGGLVDLALAMDGLAVMAAYWGL